MAPKTAMKINARLSVDDFSVLASSADTISNSTNGMDQRVGLLAVDLAADAAEIDVDDVGRRIEMQIPDMLQKHGTGNDLTLIANQIFENLEFTWQKFDFTTRSARRPGDEIQLEVTNPQHRILGHRIAAPSKRLDARQQFRESERLYKIVVAAGAQATNPIVDLTKGADNQSRRHHIVFPQLADDSEPIDTWKHAINNDDGIFQRTGAAQTIVSIGGKIDLITAPRQCIDEMIGCFTVVLNDQNAAASSGHGLYSPNPIRQDHLNKYSPQDSCHKIEGPNTNLFVRI